MATTNDKLTAAFATYQDEDVKFEGGNKSAGTRARKALQEIKTLCGDRRKEIQESKNAE